MTPTFKHTEADDTLIVVMTTIDTVEIYHGKRVIVSVALSAATAVRLAWFLIWTYWARWSWFGLRVWKHDRDLRHRLEAQAKRLRG